MERNDIAAEVVDRLRREGVDLAPTDMAALADKIREAVRSEALIGERWTRARQSVGRSLAALGVAFVMFIASLALAALAASWPYHNGMYSPTSGLECPALLAFLGILIGGAGVAVAWIAAGRLKRVMEEAAPEGDASAATADKAER